ncbi:MAG: hypothetical protein ABEN55_02510 [Bradymonadaceae bacterium]
MTERTIHNDMHGRCQIRQVAKDGDRQIPLEHAIADKTLEALRDQGFDPRIGSFESDNLIVNGGRRNCAQLLGGLVDDVFLNRIGFGDLGNTSKSNAYPNLDDNGLYHEIEDLNNDKNGMFLLQDGDFHTPSEDDRYPSNGDQWAPTQATVDIRSYNNVERTVLEDTNVDFTNIGVQPKDQVVLNTSTTHPLRLGVREVLSTTELVVHNPRRYETPANEDIEYRIDIPGTQLLVSRYISGDNFDPAVWGPGVLVQEAALFFNDDTMYNRVIMYPNDDDAGLFFQHSSVNGKEIGFRVEWLITF